MIGVALLVTPYFGFEIVPNMVEEGDFPIKKQNQAILGSIITCGLLYMLYYFALSGMASWGELTGDGTGQPFASLFATKQMGTTGFWAVWLWIFGLGAAVFPITTSVLGFWLSSVRMLFAMGRQNFLPKAFAKCNRHHQPILPNLLVLGISLAAIITMNYTTLPAELLHAHGVRRGGVLRDHLGGVHPRRHQAPRLAASVQDPRAACSCAS